uniref:Right handed beta helix domain-containing protein n=1 Tax=Amphimedon queenslandica TaxID=400682 RepID=A0A1X7TZ68_AMPQE
MTNSLFASPSDISYLSTINAFGFKVLSSVFTGGYFVYIQYYPLPECNNKLLHYSLILTNVVFTGSGMELAMEHGTSYNLSVIFEHVHSNRYVSLLICESIFHFSINKSSFYDITNDIGFSIEFDENLYYPTDCTYPGIQLISTLVIKDSLFYCNSYGLKISGHKYLPGSMNYHIIINSCMIYDNYKEGLFIDGTILRLTQIDIIGTDLIGNKGNKVINCDAISLSNVNVANSHSTGLTLRRALVTIKNNLIFTNNTGIVGGGLAINDSSQLTLTASAYLMFIDNHASYKGGGIYVEESSNSDIKLMIPNRPLTLINNSAGLEGGDMYGFHIATFKPLKLTNPNITSTSDAAVICLCDPHDINVAKKCLPYNARKPHIYPGQSLKFHVALFGSSYFGLPTPTDGTVKIYNSFNVVNQIVYIPNTCSLIEHTPKRIQAGKQSYLTLESSFHDITFNFIVNECPIGFSTSSSQGFCACSQSVSRENVTCDIRSLSITHNGLLWIGTYTSTPLSANASNPNACIINEECLLYCSPSPVTFQLNDTDTQCVDNRGHRMCGSCREGYSLLMGSSKCGHCHNNYIIVIAWIALFAVMGVLLVVLMIALNLTVSVGTLNGLLFYANIVKLCEPVFLKKGALPVLTQVVSWINLDFGFEICFYIGMDSYAKQWLQFAFPLYLWIIIVIIIQLCRRYGKISRLMGSNAVPVLSTLTFLSYTKLVRTIVIVLHKREVTLHCTNESVRSVSLWYEDPNIEYAKGKHAGLFGFALLVSVLFVIPYTLFLLCHPVLEKHLSHFKLFKSWSRFKPIIDAYSGPMKDVAYHIHLQSSHRKCYDALIRKLFKKHDDNDEPLLDVTESHKTVDQQRREIVPSSTDVSLRTSRESVTEVKSGQGELEQSQPMSPPHSGIYVRMLVITFITKEKGNKKRGNI